MLISGDCQGHGSGYDLTVGEKMMRFTFGLRILFLTFSQLRRSLQRGNEIREGTGRWAYGRGDFREAFTETIAAFSDGFPAVRLPATGSYRTETMQPATGR